MIKKYNIHDDFEWVAQPKNSFCFFFYFFNWHLRCPTWSFSAAVSKFGKIQIGKEVSEIGDFLNLQKNLITEESCRN